VRVTVIGTGFDGGGRPRPRAAREETRQRAERSSRDRSPRVGRSEKSELEIGDDDLDIPAFLK